MNSQKYIIKNKIRQSGTWTNEGGLMIDFFIVQLIRVGRKVICRCLLQFINVLRVLVRMERHHFSCLLVVHQK